jgi:hypothetical protein
MLQILLVLVKIRKAEISITNQENLESGKLNEKVEFESTRKNQGSIINGFSIGSLGNLMWQTADELSFGSASKASAAIELHGDHSQSQKSSDSSIFAEFNDWTNEHLNEEFSDGDEHLRKGERLAVRRREALKTINRVESFGRSRIFDFAGDIQPRSARCRAACGKTHQSKRRFSSFRFRRNPTRSRTFIETRHPARSDFRRNKIRRFRLRAKSRDDHKINVPLRGIVLDETMAVADNPVRKIESSEHKTAKRRY